MERETHGGERETHGGEREKHGGDHLEELLDEGLAETFPASDPVSIAADTSSPAPTTGTGGTTASPPSPADRA